MVVVPNILTGYFVWHVGFFSKHEMDHWPVSHWPVSHCQLAIGQLAIGQLAISTVECVFYYLIVNDTTK